MYKTYHTCKEVQIVTAANEKYIPGLGRLDVTKDRRCVFQLQKSSSVVCFEWIDAVPVLSSLVVRGRKDTANNFELAIDNSSRHRGTVVDCKVEQVANDTGPGNVKRDGHAQARCHIRRIRFRVGLTIYIWRAILVGDSFDRHHLQQLAVLLTPVMRHALRSANLPVGKKSRALKLTI